MKTYGKWNNTVRYFAQLKSIGVKSCFLYMNISDIKRRKKTILRIFKLP
jgi:hypothetical protein